MTETDFCRVCLSNEFNLYRIENTVLRKYEEMMKTKINTNDGRPETVCYICYAHIKKFSQLRVTAYKSELIFRHLLKRGVEVTHSAASGLVENKKPRFIVYRIRPLSITIPTVDITLEVKSENIETKINENSDAFDINDEDFKPPVENNLEKNKRKEMNEIDDEKSDNFHNFDTPDDAVHENNICAEVTDEKSDDLYNFDTPDDTVHENNICAEVTETDKEFSDVFNNFDHSVVVKKEVIKKQNKKFNTTDQVNNILKSLELSVLIEKDDEDCIVLEYPRPIIIIEDNDDSIMEDSHIGLDESLCGTENTKACDIIGDSNLDSKVEDKEFNITGVIHEVEMATSESSKQPLDLNIKDKEPNINEDPEVNKIEIAGLENSKKNPVPEINDKELFLCQAPEQHNNEVQIAILDSKQPLTYKSKKKIRIVKEFDYHLVVDGRKYYVVDDSEQHPRAEKQPDSLENSEKLLMDRIDNEVNLNRQIYELDDLEDGEIPDTDEKEALSLIISEKKRNKKRRRKNEHMIKRVRERSIAWKIRRGIIIPSEMHEDTDEKRCDHSDNIPLIINKDKCENRNNSQDTQRLHEEVNDISKNGEISRVIDTKISNIVNFESSMFNDTKKSQGSLRINYNVLENIEIPDSLNKVIDVSKECENVLITNRSKFNIIDDPEERLVIDENDVDYLDPEVKLITNDDGDCLDLEDMDLDRSLDNISDISNGGNKCAKEEKTKRLTIDKAQSDILEDRKSPPNRNELIEIIISDDTGDDLLINGNMSDETEARLLADDEWNLPKPEKKIRSKNIDKFENMCNVCGKKFKSMYTLKKHKKNCHKLIKTYPCSSCEKVFYYKGARKEHIKSDHKKIKRNYHCDNCKRRFKGRARIILHLKYCERVFDKATRRFVCEWCSKSFTKRVELKIHSLFVKHPNKHMY